MFVSQSGNTVEVNLEAGVREKYVWGGVVGTTNVYNPGGGGKGQYGILTYYTSSETDTTKKEKFLLKKKNKMTYYFKKLDTSSTYYLEKIVDRNGNEIQLEYTGLLATAVKVKRTGDSSALKVLGIEYNAGSLVYQVKQYENDGTTVAKTVVYYYNYDNYHSSLSNVYYPGWNGDHDDAAAYYYTNDSAKQLTRIVDVRSPKGYTEFEIYYADAALGQVSYMKAPHGTGGSMITVGNISSWTLYGRSLTDARGNVESITIDDYYNVKSETDKNGDMTF